MNFTAEFNIGKLEFKRILLHPFIIIIILVLTFFIYVSNAGGSDIFRQLSITYDSDAFMLGFSQTWYSTAMVCMVLAAFFGATSISQERWKNSIDVLLTKPLYKKDYIIGKFLGVSASMLLFITFILLFTGLINAVSFREPLSITDFLWRIIVYITILTLSCSLVAAFNMLIGIISKNILFVVAASMTFIFMEWYWMLPQYLPILENISPMRIYEKMCGHGAGTRILLLFDTLSPFSSWFNYAIPYICITVIGLIIILLVSIALFTRSENR